MEGDYLELNQFPNDFHQFSYNSYQEPLGFQTNLNTYNNYIFKLVLQYPLFGFKTRDAI